MNALNTKCRVLTTFGFHKSAAQLEISRPTFLKYAKQHNYTYFEPSLSFFKDLNDNRPFSWWKLPLFFHLFAHFDQILWLDADVVIVDHEVDIFDEVGEANHAVVEHQVGGQIVPNCGVWALNSNETTFEMLCRTWAKTQHTNHPWWEQRALIEVMQENTMFKNTPLNYEWNPHLNDVRGVNVNARFRHATMYPDVLGTMKGWANAERD